MCVMYSVVFTQFKLGSEKRHEEGKGSDTQGKSPFVNSENGKVLDFCICFYVSIFKSLI